MRLYNFTIFLSFILFFSFANDTFADNEKAAQLYEDAVMRLNNDDTKGAIVQLKNALKENPDMLPARVLLGKAYLKDNQPDSAENELLNANILGADQALTLLPLAQAYYAQFKFRTLIKNIDITGLPADIQSQLLVIIGLTELKLGKIAEAGDSFKQAEQLYPIASAVSGRALVLMHQGKLDEAKKMLTRAEQLDANEASIWTVRASISHLQGNLKKALEEYGQSLALDKNNLDARLARIGIYLDLNQHEAAYKEIEVIHNEYEFEPRSIYLYAILLLRENNYPEAQKALQKAANIISEINPVILNNSRTLLLLSGMVFYDLKQYEQAINYLDLFIKKHPQEIGARKILGNIYLHQRKYSKALEILKPAYQLAPNNPRLLALLGNAYMYTGQPDKAVTLLEKAAVFSNNKANIRTDLALGYLSAGEPELSLSELKSIYEGDTNQTSTGMVLMLVYYKLGKLDKALQLAKQLIIKEADNVVFLNWMGSIEAANGDYENANKHFQQAISLNPDFIAAQINQGKLLLAQNQPEEAKAHYKLILQQHPDHIATIIELARVYEFEGNYQKAIQIVEPLLHLNKEDISTRLYLIHLYTLADLNEKAYYLAEETQDLAPKNMDILLTIVSTALAAGKPDDAKLAFKHMKDIALTDGESFFRIARAELQAGFLKDAISSMSLSLHYRPDYLPAQIILVESLIQDGQIQYAADLAKEIKQKYPERNVSYRLTGDILMQQNHPEQAIKEYQKALNLKANSQNILNLYQTLAQNHMLDDGIKLLTDWLKKHSNDHQVRYALAQANFQKGDIISAQKNLEIILRSSPEQALLLNNLANLYALSKSPQAIETARKAIKLAPYNPEINDTLGWLLVQNNKATEGLRYLREAHFRKGENPEIRYHIAVALHQLGRNKEALNELKIALGAKQTFNGIKDAEKLNKELNK